MLATFARGRAAVSAPSAVLALYASRPRCNLSATRAPVYRSRCFAITRRLYFSTLSPSVPSPSSTTSPSTVAAIPRITTCREITAASLVSSVPTSVPVPPAVTVSTPTLLPIGTPIRLRAWIKSVRAQKQLAFVSCNDGSDQAGVQITCDPSLVKGFVFEYIAGRVRVYSISRPMSPSGCSKVASLCLID